MRLAVLSSEGSINPIAFYISKASGVVHTTLGDINVSYAIENNIMNYKISAPSSVNIKTCDNPQINFHIEKE